MRLQNKALIPARSKKFSADTTGILIY